MPNGKYKGQKLMSEVITKTIANMPKIIAAVPEMMPAKYKTAITVAINKRIVLSVVLMFFFIIMLYIIYCLIYTLPCATIDDILKAVSFQNELCLTASVSA